MGQIEVEVPDDEPLLVVDITDRVVGDGTKPDIHRNRQWHRQSYVLMLNDQHEILLQQRSHSRQFDGGKWTTSVSGHVTGTDTYLRSAEREIREEIGVEPPALVYLGKVLAYSEAANEVCGGPSAVFVGHLNISIDEIHVQPAEVESVKWFPVSSVAEALRGESELEAGGERVAFSDDFRSVAEFFFDHYRTGEI
jgi:isopentenyldiphosphate isomerase